MDPSPFHRERSNESFDDRTRELLPAAADTPQASTARNWPSLKLLTATLCGLIVANSFVGCTANDKGSESRNPPKSDATASSDAASKSPNRKLAGTGLFEPSLTKEPGYQSKPHYTVVRFGAAGERAFWTAFDLESFTLFCDVNSNGDLTEPSERFPLEEAEPMLGVRRWNAVVPEVSSGENVHTLLTLQVSAKPVGPESSANWEYVKAIWSVKLWGWDNSTTEANLIPLYPPTDRSHAPQVHFNGPLTMGRYRARTELPRGKSVDFYSFVGTRGSGDGTFTAITNSEIPSDAHPQAVFSFPHQNAGEPPIEVKTFLKVRC